MAAREYSVILPGLAAILWAGMLAAPTALQGAKLALLVCILAGLTIVMLFAPGRYRLHTRIARACSVFAGVGIAFVFLGAVHGGRGALAVLTTYVVWPVVFSALLTLLTHEKQLRSIVHVLTWSGLLALAYIVLFTLSMTGWISPSWVPPIYDETQSGLAVGEGFLEVSVRQLSSLLFLGPCFLGLLVAWPALRQSLRSRLGLLLIVAGALLVSAFGGRRALLVGMVVGFLVATLLVQFLPRALRAQANGQVRRTAALSAVLLGLAVVAFSVHFEFDVGSYLEFLATGLDFENDRSAIARREQLWALLGAWLERPWLGWGLGTSVHGFLRSATHPWAYELSYVALLFQTGVLGVTIYALGVIWIVCQGIRVIRIGGVAAGHMVGALTGMAAFLVGNATNPYLQKFDFMFVLFYPLAVINWHLLNMRPGPAVTGSDAADEVPHGQG